MIAEVGLGSREAAIGARDGEWLLRRLRPDPLTASIPCIALSANAMPEDVQSARAAGFDDYWTKPIDLKAFLSAIDRLMPTL